MVVVQFARPVANAGDPVAFDEFGLDAVVVVAVEFVLIAPRIGEVAWSPIGDTLLIGAQIGTRAGLGNGELLAAAGYYHYTEAQGHAPFFDGDPRGNRVDGAGNLLSDFHIVEGLAEYSVDVAGFRVAVYADYANNTGAERFETAYGVGADLKRGKWAFGWAYQDIEADAVFALFSDSDFIGGGTDGRGHILESAYALGQRTRLKAALFLNQRNPDSGREEDYRRLQLDVQFRF